MVTVDISVMVMCNDVIIKYDRRRSWLSSAPLDIEYDNNMTEQSTAIAIVCPKDQHEHKHQHINPLI